MNPIKQSITHLNAVIQPLWILALAIVCGTQLAIAQESLITARAGQQPYASPTEDGPTAAARGKQPLGASNKAVVATSSTKILIEPLPGASSAPVVTAISASHDGRFLALAGDDHVIRLLDVLQYRHVQNLVGHTDWIQCVVFSADSQELYSTGNDGRVLRWRHQYPVEPEEIVRLPFAIRSISLSSQRQLLALGGFSSEVKVWDLAAKAWKYQFTCECGDHNCVRFSPDGNKLLSGGRDGMLEVWNMENGQEIRHKKLHHKRISTAAFSLDGSQITSAGEDRHLIQYDVLTDEIVLDREIANTKLRSLCLINEHLVAVAGADNSIRLYDMVNDNIIALLEGHSGSVTVMCPCNDLLVSGSYDTTVRLWNLEDEVRRQPHGSKPVGQVPLDVDARMRIR